MLSFSDDNLQQIHSFYVSDDSSTAQMIIANSHRFLSFFFFISLIVVKCGVTKYCVQLINGLLESHGLSSFYLIQFWPKNEKQPSIIISIDFWLWKFEDLVKNQTKIKGFFYGYVYFFFWSRWVCLLRVWKMMK